jgi:hypothetical protein
MKLFKSEKSIIFILKKIEFHGNLKNFSLLNIYASDENNLINLTINVLDLI